VLLYFNQPRSDQAGSICEIAESREIPIGEMKFAEIVELSRCREG